MSTTRDVSETPDSNLDNGAVQFIRGHYRTLIGLPEPGEEWLQRDLDDDLQDEALLRRIENYDLIRSVDKVLKSGRYTNVWQTRRATWDWVTYYWETRPEDGSCPACDSPAFVTDSDAGVVCKHCETRYQPDSKVVLDGPTDWTEHSVDQGALSQSATQFIHHNFRELHALPEPGQTFVWADVPGAEGSGEGPLYSAFRGALDRGIVTSHRPDQECSGERAYQVHTDGYALIQQCWATRSDSGCPDCGREAFTTITAGEELECVGCGCRHAPAERGDV